MQKRLLPIVMFVLAAAIIAHVGCSGSSTPNVRPTIAPPQSASTTEPLAVNTALPIPALGGFQGSFEESGAVPAGATVKLTSYYLAPPGAPQPLAKAHADSSGSVVPSVGAAVFFVSQTYSSAITFSSFPTSTWHLPSSLASSGPFELETIDATSGLLLDTEFQASFSGNVVSFPGTSATFSTLPGHTYWWELITGFASAPPAGCGSNSVSPTLTTSAQVVDLTPLCNFTGTVDISANNAPSGTWMNIYANVPAVLGSQGPPVPAGTTTGVISFATEVGSATTFNSGFLQFSVRLPSSIPVGGKTFYVSACTIELEASPTFSYNGCVDTPYLSGPLSIKGQTLSFAGLPAPVVLSGSFAGLSNALNAIDESRCFKHCTPPPAHFDYLYTVAIYY